ncbi:mechanosensitive ion channel domain-containing protein [Roseobacter sp.]|uniref:mechanosensitive ion channel family protein n=1 Tax=Roseobacter sp. TaxID=1907202 RepID=UPI0025E1D494|nr:mechanosensitive ion channel domain-containing protein [Roseobacter sp.]
MFKIILTAFIAFLAFSAPGAAQTTDDSCDLTRWFCTDTLNEGMTTEPRFAERDTPRATVESLLFFARNQSWDEAGHLFDLSEIAPEQRGIIGAELGRKFETVVSRKAIINWETLVDRPDGLDAQANSKEPMSGQPRKSLLLWTIDLDGKPVTIRLNRIKADGEAPVWVFSKQTVSSIDALYERYGPSKYEDMLPAGLRENAFFGLMWWEVLALPLLICAAAFAGRMTWLFFGFLSRRISSEVVSDVFTAVRGPASTGAATGMALAFASNVFVFSGQITTVLTPVGWLGLMASVLWLGVNAVEVVLDRLTEFDETDLTQRQEAHTRTMATRVAAARRAFVVIVALVGGGFFLSQTNIFQNLGLTLLGTAGALTLVLGFAARRVLGNIMSSLQIALNQSARIGDRIVYKDYLCHVERINFTYVQLRDWDGTRLVVPVEEFVSTPFENWTMKEPEMLRIIKIKCSHAADVDELREAFHEIITELDDEELGDLDNVKVRVAGHDVFGKDVWFALPCADPNTSWDMACKAREKILAFGTRLEQENDVVIFPNAQAAEAA